MMSKTKQNNIPDGWKWKALGDVASDVMYGMNRAANDYDGKNGYIRITDIDEHTRKFQPDPLTSPEGGPDDNYKLKVGDMVFARTGASVGKTYLYEEKDGNIYFAGFLIRFSILKTNSKFVYYQTLLGSYRNWVYRISVRSGQPGINAEEYKSLKIIFPPVKEQNRIVEIIEKWDLYLEKLERKIELKKNIKKGLMQQLLTGRNRIDGYKDSWMEVKLKDVCDVNPTSSRMPEQFKYIDLESVEKGVLKEPKTILLENAPSRAQRFLRENDVLFQTVRPYQMNNYYFSLKGDYVASTGYAQLRVKNSPYYLYLILHTDDFVNKVLKRCTGSNYPVIKSSDLADIDIRIPKSIEEQEAIAKVLKLADEEIKVLKLKQGNIEAQKKYLLNNLITGKIRTSETLKV